MLLDLLPLLLLGAGLGVVHALEADHVMALLAINNQTTRLKRIAYRSTYWAIGHGGVLLACGVLLFGFGVIIPESLQWLAEFSVGVVLVLLGLGCFWQLRKATLKVHSHGDVQHIHWHTKEHAKLHSHEDEKPSKQLLKENHKPLMIGMLHGLAGSAPVLALIPALNQGHLSVAVIYLLLFSIGMMLSMVAFGLGFAYCQQFMQSKFQSIAQWSRYLLASLSIGLGAFWMFQASV